MDSNTTNLTADQLLGQYLAKGSRGRKSKAASHGSQVNDWPLAGSLGLGDSRGAGPVSVDNSTVSKAVVGSVPGRKRKLGTGAKGSNSVGEHGVDAEFVVDVAAGVGADARADTGAGVGAGVAVGVGAGSDSGTSVSSDPGVGAGSGAGVSAGSGIGVGVDVGAGSGVGAGMGTGPGPGPGPGPGVGMGIGPAAPISPAAKNPASTRTTTRSKSHRSRSKIDKRCHQPTDELRHRVRMLAWAGVARDDIAKAMGMDIRTLYRYYGRELDEAVREANAMVADRLLRKALNGDTTCMLFWLKCRAGWREYAPLPPSLPNGAPKELDQLSTEELRRLRDAMLKVQAEHHRERDLLVQSITPTGKPN